MSNSRIQQVAAAALPLLAALFAALAVSSAQAGGVADHLTPFSSNTTDPSNWRIAPGQLFNGAPALDASVKRPGCSGGLLAGGAMC